MSDLTYVGLISGAYDPYNDRRGPRLQVATPTGRVREIPMTRLQLIRLIRSAAGALEHLDRQSDES